MNKLISPRAYLRDHLLSVVIFTTLEIVVALILLAFKVNIAAIIVTLVAFALLFAGELAVGYWRRRRFYRALIYNLQQLDQAYLVVETLETPDFYDGKILCEALYQTNKSMIENVKKYQAEARAFREYIELWIHEVKTPLTTLLLVDHDPKMTEQVQRLDHLVEQVLFFSRAENAEHDYLIGEVELGQIVHQVALRSRSLLQAKAIDLVARNLDVAVQTDAKWLEFIIGQIISNSAKYGATKITVSADKHVDRTVLKILDNGIGIDPKDLPRVFDKSFTGQNGHQAGSGTPASTGMGLYIVKTLCDKLGCKIQIDSELGKSTSVEIIFHDHDYYKNVI